MLSVSAIAEFLQQFAPPRLAESWDNVGLLVGDENAPAGRIMTCLTVTGASAAEAIAEKADLIVAHHPLPFRPLARLTTGSVEGRLLLDLIAAKIAIYSPHTAFDSAAWGINRRLAEGLQLTGIAPLVPADDADESIGAGRFGELDAPVTLAELAGRTKQFLAVENLQVVGDLETEVSRVAVACGSAGEFLAPARRAGCDAFVTGETRFHTCLEAEATGVALVLAGHFASERFAVECLADLLSEQFPDATVWPSRREQDPIRWT